MITLVNLGSVKNSNDADTLSVAFSKVNENFKYIQSKIDNDLKFKSIEWNSFEDTLPCVINTNENFSKLE